MVEHCCRHTGSFFFLRMPQRVSFYIDGFNFYNGLKAKSTLDRSWKKYYWIDFVDFCEQFLGPDQVLEKIKYFTAPPLNVQKQKRQGKLFKANRLRNPTKLEFIIGKYYKINVHCPNCSSTFQKPEEKRTDVNISVHLIGDCALNNADICVSISADSDLAPALNYIKNNFQDKKIRLYFPPERSSADLFNVMSRKVVYLANNKKKFDEAVMPDTINVGGNRVTIPPEWKV